MPHTVDMVFVGSGIACSMTLLEMAQGLLDGPPPPARLRIAVIERDQQLWCGIPYGRRTSVRSLAIQQLDEFIAEPERSAYIAWLQSNKSRWLSAFCADGGDAAKRWLRDNGEAVEANRWGELYLPRHVFGVFIAEQVERAIAALDERGLAVVETVRAEAVGIRSVDGRYRVELNPLGHGPARLEADRVVLATGSPLTRTIVGCDANQPFTYINDLYLPDEDATLLRVREALDGVEVPAQRNVLIVGSNATSLEALYLMRHDASIRERVSSITVISRSGVLPYQICDGSTDFDFAQLNALLSEQVVTAAELMGAISADLATAAARSMNLADLYHGVDALLVQALTKMDAMQQEEFFCVHGMNYTKLVRRAGRDCRMAATELAAAGQLAMLAGEVLRVDARAAGRAVVRYRDADGEHTHPVEFAVVVNCGGFEELDSCSSPLLVSAMQNGICRPNRTNRGVLVNDDFEAAQNFYVIGPLIGGNFNPRLRFWHVESAPRIRSLAKSLAAVLLASLRAAADLADSLV